MTKSLGSNIAKLLSSKVAAQIVAYASAPVIARLFSPSDFGIRQIFLSIFGVISIISCLRYEFSIPLGKNDREASASFILSLFLALVFALLLLALVPFLRGIVAQWFQVRELSIFLWFYGG